MSAKLFKAGGTDNNWSTSNNWTPAGQPAAGDDVTFNASSPACTVTSGATCKSIDFSGGGSSNYANTITFTNAMNVAGNVTLPTAATMTFAGASAMTVSTTATLTGNGQTFGVPMILSGAVTYTFSGVWASSGSIAFTSGATTTLSGSNASFASCTFATASTVLTLNVNISITGTTTISTNISLNGGSNIWNTSSLTINAALSGTATLNFSGGGTWSGSGSGYLNMNTTIGGTLTLSGNIYFGNSGTPTLTWNSGAVTQGSSTLNIYGTSTYNLTANVTLNNVSLQNVASITVTLSSQMTVAGTLTLPASFSCTFSGSGLLSLAQASFNPNANTGTGFSCPISCVGMSLSNIAITFGGTVTCSGTVTITGGASALTFNALLTANTISLPIGQNVTISGTGGFTVGTLTTGATAITGNRTLTLGQGGTYTVTTNINILTWSTSTVASYIYTITSSSGSLLTVFKLSYGASQTLQTVSPTRLDSSGGQTLYSQQGTITTSYNWSISLANGNISNAFTGAGVVISGVTYDKSGNVLGSCTVYLFRDNGNSTATFVAATTSNAGTGAYTFTVFPGSTYFVVVFGVVSTVHVFDCTDRILTAA
jgi:trimeric autotransporter adhesin